MEGCLLIDYITGQYFIHQHGNSVNESNKVGEEGCLQFLAFEVNPPTICRCTGLPDKNGKKIWEGDILSAHLDESYPEDVTYVEIKWNGFSWCIRESTIDDILTEYDCNTFEVCGNIFDNPELLEGGVNGENELQVLND